MHLFILILGSTLLLLPKAYTLKCNQCVKVPGGGPCTEQECPASNECAAMRAITYVGDTKQDTAVRSCMPSVACFTGSINYGSTRMVVNTKCCSTDLCNKEDAPEPSASSSPNGKKCYGCTPNDMKCNTTTTTVDCMGDEDRCMKATVTVEGQKRTMKACVTQSICSAGKMTSAEMAGLGEVTCCTGDLCNSARSIGVGLLLLVAPIVSVALLL